jgi:hypothetical protein
MFNTIGEMLGISPDVVAVCTIFLPVALWNLASQLKGSMKETAYLRQPRRKR